MPIGVPSKPERSGGASESRASRSAAEARPGTRNRLAGESSPYLRQHADNPVDWHPWGSEAFAEAAERDVPVLLSVGYSACHWCHVMAHESFEHEATAAVMNGLFVNVKVDREERPDVDDIYMQSVMAISGHGGWPMTVWLMPDGRPFFAGTYFPREGHGGRAGFADVCRAVAAAYRERRPQVEEQAGQLVEVIARELPVQDAPEAGATISAAVDGLSEIFDGDWGGFGRSPKFPQPSYLELILRTHHRTGDRRLLEMTATTLDAMASGGIYDHLGGGFARYSVDRLWLVPHFEKMLYDQAGLLRLYVHGWQVTGNPSWRQVCEEIVEYVLRDLAQPEGGISSAEDADSEGEEGRFYVWSKADVERIGGAEAIAWYGVTEQGNFEGSNILNRPTRGDLLRPAEVEAARAALFAEREKRVRPGLDDKVLTEWNAMWVSALAEAGAALAEPEWIRAAERTAEFLIGHLKAEDGRWRRSWQRDSGARHLAYAADYAWLIDAFTQLTEASGEARWIEHAKATAQALIELFSDEARGGFFTTGDDAERLIIRAKESYDGATPSAGSVAAAALARLGALTGDDKWTEYARKTVDALSAVLAVQPTALTAALAAVDLLAHGTTEVVITGDRPDLVAEVHRRYLPDAVTAFGERYPSPLWEGRDLDGAAYVCRNYACQLPVTTTDELARLLAPVA